MLTVQISLCSWWCVFVLQQSNNTVATFLRFASFLWSCLCLLAHEICLWPSLPENHQKSCPLLVVGDRYMQACFCIFFSFFLSFQTPVQGYLKVMVPSAQNHHWLISMKKCSFPSQTNYTSLNWFQPHSYTDYTVNIMTTRHKCLGALHNDLKLQILK